MSIERAKAYLKQFDLENKILKFDSSSATVELASQAIGCSGAQIAKSLTFMVNNEPIMIVCAGDAKVDNQKYKAFFGTKATMLSFDQVEEMIGHAVGGVCPFGINQNVKVYLDESLKRFEKVYPACGSSNSAVNLMLTELEKVAQNSQGYIDVCKYQ